MLQFVLLTGATNMGLPSFLLDKVASVGEAITSLSCLTSSKKERLKMMLINGSE